MKNKKQVRGREDLGARNGTFTECSGLGTGVDKMLTGSASEAKLQGRVMMGSWRQGLGWFRESWCTWYLVE